MGNRPSKRDRQIQWHDPSVLFATLFGVGYIPGAPGTYGTIAFVPCVMMASNIGVSMRWALFGVVVAFSCYVSHVAGSVLGEPDSCAIVIDEAVGLWLGLIWFGAISWPEMVLGAVLFRIFDIVKVYPAGWLDNWYENGLTVVADDLVAGLWTAGVMLLCKDLFF